MISILRRLRRSFLEQSQARKYLMYAVGEIILVVFGILIALQINSWAVHQDNLKLEKSYLEALRFELSDDIKFYTGVKDSLLNQKTYAQNILYFFENPMAKIKDSISFINDFRNCSDGENLIRPQVTWKELQSTGRLSLIRNKRLVKQLFEYYTILDQFAADFNKFPMDQRYAYRKIQHALFNSEEHIEFFEDWNQEQIPRQFIYTAIRSDPQLFDLTKSILISSLVQSRYAQNTLDLATSLLQDIDREIDDQ
ncbi:hypothetical protein ACA086_05535 [Muriicola sp. E247]|uniref:hypothetical protein n=1 Tax=Muriicola sp. E247 TaxID=3242730 RepID=UPI003525B0EB